MGVHIRAPMWEWPVVLLEQSADKAGDGPGPVLSSPSSRHNVVEREYAMARA